MSVRRLWSTVVVLVLLACAGCLRVQSNTTITDDTHVTVALDLATAKTDPLGSIESFCGLMKEASTLPGGMAGGLSGSTTVQSYDDGTYVGCRITSTTTVQATTTNSYGEGQLVTVRHADGLYTFTFNPRNSTLATPYVSGGTSGLDSFRVSVTFPGPVTASSGDGQVSGRTVTWSAPSDVQQVLTASGRDAASSGSWLRAVLLVLGVLVVLGLLILLLLRRVRARRTPPPPSPQWVDPASTVAPGATAWAGDPAAHHWSTSGTETPWGPGSQPSWQPPVMVGYGSTAARPGAWPPNQPQDDLTQNPRQQDPRQQGSGRQDWEQGQTQQAARDGSPAHPSLPNQHVRPAAVPQGLVPPAAPPAAAPPAAPPAWGGAAGSSSSQATPIPDQYVDQDGVLRSPWERPR